MATPISRSSSDRLVTRGAHEHNEQRRNLGQTTAQFSIYILFNFATLLLEVPLVRLFEQAICHRHFRHVAPPPGGFDERDCKIPEVQHTLGSIVGGKMFFDAVPGIMMAVYYGYLAERIGCRPVLIIATLGYSLMLSCIVLVCSLSPRSPIQLAWLSSMFLFIGGGQRVFNSMVFTLTSHSLPVNQRTKYLFLLAAGPHICRLITPRIAALLMTHDILDPFWLAFGCFALIGTIIPFVGRTKLTSEEPEYQPISADAEPFLNTNTGDQNEDEEEARQTIHRREHQWCDWPQTLHQNISVIANLFDSPASRFCLAAFFTKRLGFSSEGFMFQYASEKFQWELRKTTWLRVSSAVGAVFVSLVVGPLVNSRAIKRRIPSPIVDLNTIRWSLITLVVSFCAAWLAPSAVFLAIAMLGCGLGEALEPALQGFAITSTGSARNSLLFTTVAQCDTIAELVAGPLMASLLAIGRTQDHASDGVPFLASSAMFACLFAWSFAI